MDPITLEHLKLNEHNDHLNLQPIKDTIDPLNTYIRFAESSQYDVETLEKEKENTCETIQGLDAEGWRRVHHNDRAVVKDKLPRAIEAMKALLKNLEELDMGNEEDDGDISDEECAEEDESVEDDQVEEGEYPIEANL